MTEFLQFALLGLGVGASYALLAQGLVVVQTASGVINFAHGAIGMIGAFVCLGLQQQHGWSFWPAFIVGIGTTSLIGLAAYQLIMRPLRAASALARVVASLGLLLALESAALLIWGNLPRIAEPLFGSSSVNFSGGVTVGRDKVIMFGIAVALTAALWAAYRYTRLGLAITSAAESERAAAALGWSPHTLAAIGWTLGGGLAGTAVILIAPLSGLQVDDLTLLVIPTLAAGLAGGFTSFPLTLLGALTIGMCQSLLANYAPSVQGLPTALPFAVIIIFLVIRGQSLPSRGVLSTFRLPEIGSGEINWRALAVVLLVSVLLVSFVFNSILLAALTVTVAWATILLSVVVLMGYAGQIDLAPLAWGGIAALIVARLVRDTGIPFELAFVIGVAGAIPVGLLFGIPALRARGLNLAIVTLGLGVMLHALVFSNGHIVGDVKNGDSTINVGSLSVFGINIDPINHPARYLVLVILCFTAAALVVANLRRGKVGRQLIAIRVNERAAAAMGISVFGSKLYAFGFASTLAAVGGVLYGFQSQQVDIFNTYTPIGSMLAATQGVIGGVGFLVGPLLGAPLVAGGFGSWLLDEIFPGANAAWLALIGGVTVILMVIQNPNGLVRVNVDIGKLIWRQVRRVARKPAAPRPRRGPALPEVAASELALDPKTLRIDGLTVRYGGVTAVDDVSLVVEPGQIVGLIGPNGAGKTSLIDAVTGFTRAASGSMWIGDDKLDGRAAHKIARAGVCRSFQSLELFETSTLRENIAVASDERDMKSYFTDLVRPDRSGLSPLATVAIREFELESQLDMRVDQLPYGARRLAAIARTIAIGPSLLLLDEPAAGLSETESAELMHIVRRLAKQWNLGVLLVEHDMAFVMSICDRITVLDFGRCIAEGTPAEVREDPAVITAYLGTPEENVEKEVAR